MSGPCAILEPMCGVWEVPVKRVRNWGEIYAFLELEAPALASRIQPGQFLMAAPAEFQEIPYPLLKRALAVYDVASHQDHPHELSLMIKAIGDGTRALSRLEAGERISLVGPLGNGFDLEASSGCHCLLVAGGIGIASLLLLGRRLLELGRSVSLLYGGRRETDLVGLDDFQALGIPCRVTTEDGSRGRHGLVTVALDEMISRRSDPLYCYICGPNPMMQAVTRRTTRAGIPCQLSVETKMACGFGVCLGCSVLTTGGYRLACTHGPVFPADSFVWEGSGNLEQILERRELSQ